MPSARYAEKRTLITFAALILLSLWWVSVSEPATAQNDVGQISRKTIVDPAETVSLIVAGTKFTVPINWLDTYIEPDRYAPDEVAGGFSFVGLLPDFEMRTQASLPHFLGRSGVTPIYKDVVTTYVQRLCPTSARSCNPDDAFQSAFVIYGGDQFYPAPHELPYSEDIAGLDFLGVANNVSGQPQLSDRFRAVFLSSEAAPSTDFITCGVSGTILNPAPRCFLYSRWADGIWLEISFSAVHLENWRTIKGQVDDTMNGFAAASAR